LFELELHFSNEASKMKQRTESDAASLTPIDVKFGGKDYHIPLLTVVPQREWRKLFFAELNPLMASFDAAPDPKTMINGLSTALLQFPDKLVELVFAYREYGFACETLLKGGTSPRNLLAEFMTLRQKGPLPEAEDLPRDEILSTATEEQIAPAFSSISAVAFPYMPQLQMTRQLLKAAASQP
jgi:hypothetical protein